MRYLHIILQMILIISSIACSKTNHLPQTFIRATQTYVSPSIKIDTIFNYTFIYQGYLRYEKSFDLAALDEVSNPGISIYYKVSNSTGDWIRLPQFTAWYNRNGRIITVYMLFRQSADVSVRIVAAW